MTLTALFCFTVLCVTAAAGAIERPTKHCDVDNHHLQMPTERLNEDMN